HVLLLAPKNGARRSHISTEAEQWRVDHALRRLATLAGVQPHRVDIEVARVIDALEIGEHSRKRVKALSKGNFQRVGLAQAMLREHDVVVFDEPTHGLDPIWTHRFRAVVSGLRRPDRTIVIASHNLDELERVADRVAIIDRGRLQRVVSMGGSGDVGARVYRVRSTGDPATLLSAFPGAAAIGTSEIETVAMTVTELNASLQRALAAGGQVTSLAPRESALEAEFHAAVGAAPRGAP
ncbi:MAG: ATP-binding cassette domain-containing protein, partial [Gemmatimonadetes bacterium]|nr:ATP-binding cassette domain-containing protein [Gemmatimonadota bacterium]